MLRRISLQAKPGPAVTSTACSEEYSDEFNASEEIDSQPIAATKATAANASTAAMSLTDALTASTQTVATTLHTDAATLGLWYCYTNTAYAQLDGELVHSVYKDVPFGALTGAVVALSITCRLLHFGLSLSIDSRSDSFCVYVRRCAD